MQSLDTIIENIKTHPLVRTHGILFAIAFIILVTFLNNIGTLGAIGQDIDDVIRLVQIKDYLEGQSWFDTDQYRMGLAGGTDMHWSRIPDIPIIFLTHVFDVFMSSEGALVWAYTVWPPLSALLLIYGCLKGVQYWVPDALRQRSTLFVLILAGLFVFSFYRFKPGSIDHHNLQMGFLCLAMGFTLDPKLRFWTYLISGFATAMSVAIGVETYIFAVIICGFIALNWVYYGRDARLSTQGFGVGFSLTLLMTFVGTVPPENYGLIYCDALSLITISAGIIGGLGLAILAKLGPVIALEKSWFRRGLGLVILGLICAGVLIFQAPQCLSNPLDNLPEEVISLWLNNVEEAKPIAHPSVDKAALVPYMIGAPIIAIIVLCYGLRKSIHEPSNIKNVQFLPLVLLISALGLTFYQIRFYPFAYVFAIVPLAGWVAQVYTHTKRKNSASVLYLGALALAYPMVWMFPGAILKNNAEVEKEKATNEQVARCQSTKVLDALNTLPAGMILANPNMSGVILMETRHRVVSGNYHRNWKGISNQIEISISDPAIAGNLILESNIDYLYFCKMASENDIYIPQNENSLTAKLSEGFIPDYLEVLSSPDLEGGGVIIFKVVNPQT